jgi:hypothetical protein
MAGERRFQQTPPRADVGALTQQRVADIGTNAVDVNVELVLRASRCRIDSQAQHVARHRVPERLFDKTPRLPGFSKVVAGKRRKKRGVLDAADLRRWDEQKLRRAGDVFEHRESAGEIDFGARFWIAVLLLVRHALTVHDLPKHIRI